MDITTETSVREKLDLLHASLTNKLAGYGLLQRLKSWGIEGFRWSREQRDCHARQSTKA